MVMFVNKKNSSAYDQTASLYDETSSFYIYIFCWGIYGRIDAIYDDTLIPRIYGESNSLYDDSTTILYHCNCFNNCKIIGPLICAYIGGLRVWEWCEPTPSR